MIGSDIGALRHRVRIERAVATPEPGGAEAIAWTSVATVFADIKTRSGREALADDAFAGTLVHLVRLRFRSDTRPGDRLVFGTRIFNIRAVRDPDMRGRWLICDCEEDRL